MDLYEALYTTRAIRRLKPDPIPYEVEVRILDEAIRAPNIEQGQPAETPKRRRNRGHALLMDEQRGAGSGVSSEHGPAIR